MRVLLTAVAVFVTVAAAQLVVIPQQCKQGATVAALINKFALCTSADKYIDPATCTIKNCGSVKATDASANCPSRNSLKYSCDLTGKHTKKLVDDKGCFLCDYATPVVNNSELTTDEKCPRMKLPKCAAGVKPPISGGCPSCRPQGVVGDSSSSCSQQSISACAQRLGSSLKYCPQSTSATIDSSCCPSCKPVCQGAASPFELEAESKVSLTSRKAWKKMKQVVMQDWSMPTTAQWSLPTGWPTATGDNSFLKCSGGGGFNGGGGGGNTPNNGGGNGGGGGGGNGGGGGGSDGGSGDNGGGSSNNGGSDNNGGDNADSGNNNGQTGTCTAEQKTACQNKLATLPTCSAGQKPNYDTTTCCIDCRPDNSPTPAPSTTLDEEVSTFKQCSDEEVYQCQLHTGFCKDTEPQLGDVSMCCKSCRRPEDLCSPMEVSKFMGASPYCATSETSQHLDGQCGPTCVPKKTTCSPKCASNQLCLAQDSGSPICVNAYETILVVKNGGKQFLSDLAGMTLDEQSYYLREVTTRYCEIPQVNDECVYATKSIASLEVVEATKLADGSVQMVVLMKGDVNQNDPTSLLVSAMSRKFSISGDQAADSIKVVSTVHALPAPSSASSGGIIAGAAIGVVALLAVAGFFMWRRYHSAQSKHTSTTSHIENATQPRSPSAKKETEMTTRA